MNFIYINSMSWGSNAMRWGKWGNTNMKMKLDIQRFAEEGANQEPTNEQAPVANEGATEPKAEPKTTFTDLLKDPEYQREFDKLVSKSLDTAKAKWEEDYQAKVSEAEKLAKMNAEQKLKYELEKSNKERDELQAKLDAGNLYKTASDIATDKGLPIGYLDLIDFSKEKAETITSRIDKLVELRTKDMENYLKSKLQQPTPQEKKGSQDETDPYIKGFKSEYR